MRRKWCLSILQAAATDVSCSANVGPKMLSSVDQRVFVPLEVEFDRCVGMSGAIVQDVQDPAMKDERCVLNSIEKVLKAFTHPCSLLRVSYFFEIDL